MEYKLVWPLGGDGTRRDGDLGMLLVEERVGIDGGRTTNGVCLTPRHLPTGQGGDLFPAILQLHTDARRLGRLTQIVFRQPGSNLFASLRGTLREMF